VKNNDLVQAMAGAAMPRRDFLRNSALLAAPLALGGTAALPAMAATYVPPTRSRGSTRISVRDMGARGNGTTDDTAAFQRAVDRLPSSGGTVYVPAGTYLIDPVKSVRLRSRMHLQLSSDAKLVAKANSAEKAYVVYAYKVSDVEISGGRIIGDRDRHLNTRGEWGHGIQVRGSNRVTIRDIHISKCWGDGICIGGADVWNSEPIKSDDVVVCNVVCTQNRRQGLSSGRANHVVIRDSEFSYTKGTAPECGIDIEPDLPADCYKVLVENCHVHHNAKYGVLVYKSAKSVTVRRCLVERNYSCGVVTVGCTATYIALNTIRYNSATGLLINDGTRNLQVSRNTFYGNYARQGIKDRTDFTYTGWTSKLERDILRRGDLSDIRITTNYYR
jgi:polygalacturonase